MHFIIAVKHIQEEFYAVLIMAHCNATLALLSHPIIHDIHNTKNKIFMTSSQFLISTMVVLCIIIEKMFILRSHYSALAQLQSKFQEGQATTENVKLTTVKGY